MGITIGVDLAAQPRETAACTIRWDPPLATVGYLAVGLSRCRLLALVEKEKPEKVAIDAPFGWPVPFVKAVADYEATGRWTGSEVPTLRLRATDRAVIAATGQQPLSVSSDRIAITAMRCARLLTSLSDAGYPVSRDGAGLAAEVYPAAALRSWGFDPKGYKGPKPEQVAKRASLIEQFASRSRSWLALDNEQEFSLRRATTYSMRWSAPYWHARSLAAMRAHSRRANVRTVSSKDGFTSRCLERSPIRPSAQPPLLIAACLRERGGGNRRAGQRR